MKEDFELVNGPGSGANLKGEQIGVKMVCSVDGQVRWQCLRCKGFIDFLYQGRETVATKDRDPVIHICSNEASENEVLVAVNSVNICLNRIPLLLQCTQ